MPAWPGTLPSFPLLESFSETAPDTALRTQMDTGPAKLRQRTTAAVRSMSVSYVLTKAQVVTLETFYRTTLTGGTLAFDFTHPRTASTVSCRFKSPPEYAAMNGNFFRVGIDLEVLP